MTTPHLSFSLTIRLTSEQLGFLAYLYPNDDPEDALIKLLERARNRAIRKAEQQVHVLYPGQEAEEGQDISPEQPISQVDDRVENPIGELQELCQRQQVSLPNYEFEALPEGFFCTVQAVGLKGTGEGPSKKMAKMEAARELLGVIGGS
ncbi:double-stranded RNA binding motif domain-containing protein [Acaryochloris sp. CCMEE 5410]|uniref:double-stranded RNA binding motif domain-containing protein n=1 Tax=Acaryochloris sp. CCMEE 5410 TaxID=310037 RepID=UPI000309FAD3|nr:double-stranded RNA binding motif domain-containing protein [Acaryochloris sp. CCMEE 5410]KAI9129050.1 RNA-binding protein [Acaryochloris sp. CCMEE 5410]